MDLEAVRQGNHVVLTWTPPSQTTDKLRIRHPGGTAICLIGTGAAKAAPESKTGENCEPVVATISPDQLQKSAAATETQSALGRAPSARASYTYELPPNIRTEHPDSYALIAIEPLNQNGRGAGFSNRVAVALAPAFPPPGEIRAEETKSAILLIWTPEQPHAIDQTRLTGYRVERSQVGGKSPDERVIVAAGSASDGHFADEQFAWGKQYEYRIAAITGVFASDGKETAEVQGEWSQPVRIETRDVFPPAQPHGLQAVFTQAGEQRFIDLTWLPNSEADLAGYQLYRRSEGGTAQRINTELIKAPAYRDINVQPGTRYFYSVSAVDLRGNEGPRSEETSELAPKQ